MTRKATQITTGAEYSTLHLGVTTTLQLLQVCMQIKEPQSTDANSKWEEEQQNHVPDSTQPQLPPYIASWFQTLLHHLLSTLLLKDYLKGFFLLCILKNSKIKIFTRGKTTSNDKHVHWPNM